MPTPAEELALVRRRTRPFGHVRLAAFFAAVGLASALAGARGGTPAAAAGIAGAAAGATGFVGVLVHRLRINRIRWRETEQFLARIERESQRYRALLEGAADMLLVVDPGSGVVLECNALARSAMGLETVRGQGVRAGGPGAGAGPVVVTDLFDARARAALARLLASAAEGEAPEALSALLLRTPSGAPRLADARAAVIRFGEDPSVLLSLRDVTRQKALERELQLRERLSSIGLMTAGVAHDINNPLEGIANYLGLLARPELSPQDRARYVERVSEGFERIRALTRELLRFARPEGGRDRVDLAEVVRRATRLASFAPGVDPDRVRRAGLDRPLLVLGDAARLEQVVFNLITNAATAIRGAPGACIELCAARLVDEEQREWIELRCEDGGPGFDPDALDHVFDPFFSRTGGAGLGLAVCYATILAHGGTLTAANREAGGAALTLRLPAAPPEAGGPAPDAAGAGDDAGA